MGDYNYHLYSHPWWGRYYESEVVFEYINGLKELQEYAQRRGLLAQIARVLGKRVSITNIINALANVDLLANKEKNTIVEEILDIFEKYDAQRTILEWFRNEAKQAAKENRLFTSVTKSHYSSSRPLSSASFSSLDSKFVLIQGGICHKSALSTNPALLESANHSACSWVLCDYPPIAMTESNRAYQGGIVNLRVDEGFERVFSSQVPFETEIGWFPRCTVAGFFNSRKVSSENYPTMTACLVIYDRVRSPTPTAAELTEFVAGELKHPIYLRDFEGRVFLYYLVPTMFRSWGIGYDKIGNSLRSLVAELIQQDKGNIGTRLLAFYENRIVATPDSQASA